MLHFSSHSPWDWGYCDFVRDCRSFVEWHRSGRRGVPVCLRGWQGSLWLPPEVFSLPSRLQGVAS